MDSVYKAWKLATIIYRGLKLIEKDKTGVSQKEIMDTRVFSRIGTDPRTQEKYWNLLLKEKYLVYLGDGKYTIVADIETKKPQTLDELDKESRKALIQKTLDEDFKAKEESIDRDVEQYEEQVNGKAENEQDGSG